MSNYSFNSHRKSSMIIEVCPVTKSIEPTPTDQFNDNEEDHRNP